MKIFFDTEFTGLRKDTTLISIGLVAENGEEFYAEFSDYNDCLVDAWIKENVIDNLYCTKGITDAPNYYYGTKWEIREYLENWLRQFSSVELVSDVCHYDMVLFIDIFGDAFSIPENVCPCCYDINQDIASYYGISLEEAFDMSREKIIEDANIEISGDKHNALYDAKVISFIYAILS